MTEVKMLIKCDEYFTKIAKLQGNSCRVGIPKKYVGKEVLLIPLLDEFVIRKLDDDTYNITTNAIDMMIKEVKEKNGTGQVFVSKKYLGCEFLITTAPE